MLDCWFAGYLLCSEFGLTVSLLLLFTVLVLLLLTMSVYLRSCSAVISVIEYVWVESFAIILIWTFLFHLIVDYSRFTTRWTHHWFWILAGAWLLPIHASTRSIGHVAAIIARWSSIGGLLKNTSLLLGMISAKIVHGPIYVFQSASILAWSEIWFATRFHFGNMIRVKRRFWFFVLAHATR